jgi:hypothetical protein
MDIKDVSAILLKTAGLVMLAYAVFESFVVAAESSGKPVGTGKS